jgi:hypothetical protein
MDDEDHPVDVDLTKAGFTLLLLKCPRENLDFVDNRE